MTKPARLLPAVVILVVAAVLVARSRLGERLLSGGPGPLPGPVLAPPPATIAPAPRLKLAFIADSGAGDGFQQVLALIRREGARAVVHMGDALYGQETAAEFWGVVDCELGHDFPYFLAQGNHDADQWPALAAHGREHARRDGAVITSASPVDPRFTLVYQGVSFVFLGHEVEDDDPRAIVDRFSRDEHVWKVCVWHKNQEALQLGGKDNQMGWGVYESCRQMGALIQTGHEHSYQRTKSLRDMVAQEVDPACADPARPCVRPGAVPVFVAGLGGQSVRPQRRCLPDRYPYGCRGEWAFAYTSNQGARPGALFITFAPDGDPRRARGAFKTVDGESVDEFELSAR